MRGHRSVTEQRLRELLHPFLPPFGEGAFSPPEDLYCKLSKYLALLFRWNARTNLTSIRDPEEMVTRHFGEGLFAAAQLHTVLRPGASLLDVGSGAGFPGLPIQLALPSLEVTLAESQGKKASFLQEAVRVLDLETEVWSSRVESMPPGCRFDIVTLRAVDRREVAIKAALDRLKSSGFLVELGVAGAPTPATLLPSGPPLHIPCSQSRVMHMWANRPDVSRGTF